MARVTALLPVKEFHADYLRRALGSMLDQTSYDWRLLVIVEEPVPSELREILEPALCDERVQAVANEGRKLAGALNTGLRHATTDYTAILLGDDMWAPEAVAALDRGIEQSPDVDFFHSGRVIVDGDDRPISPTYAPTEHVTLDDFARGAPVKHLLCWRRSKALEIGGLDESLNSVGPDDLDFPWSMAEAGSTFQAIPECLYVYRDHRDGFRLTTHLPLSTHRRELRRIFRKHGLRGFRAERRVAAAQATYLRQCLYRSPLDRWLKERRGYDPHRGWREKYE